MRFIGLIVFIFAIAGCSTARSVNSNSVRFPASANNPYQAFVCRNLKSHTVERIWYERITAGTPSPEQINGLSSKILLIASDLKLVSLENENPFITPCNCEGVAVRSNETYYVDRTLFQILPEQHKIHLQADMTMGSLVSEPTAEASKNQCDGYKVRYK